MEDAIKTLTKAIRAKCLECSGGSSSEVNACEIPECALFPHRLGNLPLPANGKNAEEPIRNKYTKAKMKKITKTVSSNSRMLSLFEHVDMLPRL